jgi:hypothetical protein
MRWEGQPDCPPRRCDFPWRLDVLAVKLCLLLMPLLLTSLPAAESSAESLATKGAQVRRDAAKNVTELWVWDKVVMTPDDFLAVKAMPALKTLFMRQITRQLDDEMLAVLGPMPSVEYLYTNMATISDDGLKELATWTGLKNLTLIHWGYAQGWKPFPARTTVIGSGLKHLAALPQLAKLDLGGARIDDSALSVVATITTLEELRLFHCGAVSDDGVAALAALPKLRAVQFGSPRITDRTLEYLSRMPTITTIEIDETWLTYANGFRYLKSLSGLTSVVMKNVVADATDVAALKADHPQAKIEWTQPDEKMLAKLTAEKARATKDPAAKDPAKKPQP